MQGGYPEGLPGMTQGEAAAHANSSQLQLPAVLQLHLPSSQPDQAAAGQLGQHQQALLQQGSLPGSGAAHLEGTAPPGGPGDLPSTSGQGQLPVNMQEQPTAKQHMLQAISDGGAMMQVSASLCMQSGEPLPLSSGGQDRQGSSVSRACNGAALTYSRTEACVKDCLKESFCGQTCKLCCVCRPYVHRC